MTAYKVDNPLYNIYVLPLGEKITPDILDTSPLSFVVQNSNVFKVQNSGIHTFMAPFSEPEEILGFVYNADKFIGYDPNQVYLLQNNHHEFPIPISEFQYAMAYFQYVYDEHKSESCVLLLINKKEKTWKILPVVQINPSGGSVKYLFPNSSDYPSYLPKDVIDPALNIMNTEYHSLYKQGYRIYGTIHSHCNFSAFHSGVDDNDEQDFNGLHITIGNVRSGWSYSARFMLDSAEFKVSIEEVLGVDKMEDVEDIEDIVISPEHKDLIVIHKQNQFKATKIPSTTGWLYKPFKPYDHYGNYYGRQYDPDLLTEDEWRAKYASNIPSSSRVDGEHVWTESELVHLFHPSTGQMIVTTWLYYSEHMDLFEDYVKFTPEIPDEVLHELDWEVVEEDADDME